MFPAAFIILFLFENQMIVSPKGNFFLRLLTPKVQENSFLHAWDEKDFSISCVYTEVVLLRALGLKGASMGTGHD